MPDSSYYVHGCAVRPDGRTDSHLTTSYPTIGAACEHAAACIVGAVADTREADYRLEGPRSVCNAVTAACEGDSDALVGDPIDHVADALQRSYHRRGVVALTAAGYRVRVEAGAG
jgi:hypothetical protein